MEQQATHTTVCYDFQTLSFRKVELNLIIVTSNWLLHLINNTSDALCHHKHLQECWQQNPMCPIPPAILELHIQIFTLLSQLWLRATWGPSLDRSPIVLKGLQPRNVQIGKPCNVGLRHVFTRQALFKVCVSCFVTTLSWADTNLTIFTVFICVHARGGDTLMFPWV